MGAVACGTDPIAPGIDASTDRGAEDEGWWGPLDASVDAAPPCVGLECQQVECGSGKTTISGTVFAPNGTLPLAGVTVYVPNAPLTPILSGTTVCDPSCKAQLTGLPLVATRTDAHGKFVLDDLPVGWSIPVVLQVGKWRRVLTIPEVKACVDTSVPSSLTRLPAKRSEGDIPRIAATTGGCDPIACLLPKLGIAASEFAVSSADAARVTLYAGEGGSGPAGITSASGLWNNPTELAKFDVALLASECADHPENKTSPLALRDWVNSGGELVATHHHAVWFRDLVADWKSTAAWGSASGTTPAAVDTTFPLGKELSDWLSGQALVPSDLPLTAIDPSVGATTPPTLAWLRPASGTSTHVLSFGAPIGTKWDAQCGRVAYADMDVGTATDVVDATFPAGCSSTFTAQEEVLAYLFFRLTACNPPSSGPGGE